MLYITPLHYTQAVFCCNAHSSIRHVIILIMWCASTADTTDECAQDPPVCGEGERCVNTPGSYMCTCTEGFIETVQNGQRICTSEIYIVCLSVFPYVTIHLVHLENISPKYVLVNHEVYAYAAVCLICEMVQGPKVLCNTRIKRKKHVRGGFCLMYLLLKPFIQLRVNFLTIRGNISHCFPIVFIILHNSSRHRSNKTILTKFD